MKKLFLLIIFSLSLSACSIPFIGQKRAALQVNSNPTATVYLNDNDVGQTPFFDDKLKPGEYTVKIEVPDQPNKTWTTNVTLSPQIVTIINRQFGDNQEESSNYLLQLEPLASKDSTEISIITIPDNVIVKIDGQPQGFSPVSLTNTNEGDHNIALSAPGYQEQIISAQVKSGFKLIVSAHLARSPGLDVFEDSPDATQSAQLEDGEADSESDSEDEDQTPKPTPTKKPRSSTATSSADLERPYVIITETGTGWLRVRSEPNTSVDNEVAKVDVGEQFTYIESNDTGWYKIEYSEGEEGWISGRYAELYR